MVGIQAARVSSRAIHIRDVCPTKGRSPTSGYFYAAHDLINGGSDLGIGSLPVGVVAVST